VKVAMVVGQFPALPETSILNQTTGLIDRGHEVDIFAANPGSTRQVHPQVATYRLRAHYAPVPQRNLSKLRLIGMAVLAARTLRDHTLPLRLLRDHADVTWTALCEARLLLRRGPYDVVHCQFGHYGQRYCGLYRVGLLKGRLVTSFRGLDLSGYLNQSGPNVYRRLFDAGDLFLPVCDFFRQKLIRLGCPADKIMVLPSGIDCRVFPVIPRRLAPGDGVRIVTVGRCVEKKGMEYAIRAVAKLVKDVSRVEYSIVGDGPLRKSLEQLIGALGMGASIKVLGWKRQDEVVEILKTAHIMLAPSVTAADGDQEGIPNALKEAMAMGLPVVSTRHAGIPELVDDGVSGYLVPERDVEALVATLRRLIAQWERWPAMGRAGRDRVEDRYDASPLNDRLIEIYRQTLAAPR
jgi:colanic acid/amylovoran biosynthesis glycosyltransferase